MKKFLTLFTLILSVSLIAPHADAKRFGGGKSFGKSYKTAPAQGQQTNTVKKQSATPQKSSNKKGMMGGLLGGLLAGGLLAALFAGGAFEGIQMMDILLIAVLAFIGFKLFKMLRGQKNMPRGHTPAYASSAPQRAQQNSYQQVPQGSSQPQTDAFSGGFGGSFAQPNDVPYNLPQGFDCNGFIIGARDHYMQIQNAWNTNDLNKIREYVAADMFDALVAERSQTSGEQLGEALFINAEIVRADYDSSKAELSLKFSGKYKETPQAFEEDIDDIWHLERDLTRDGAPWLIVGIEN